jgi:serine/threonine protein phosphatase 1
MKAFIIGDVHGCLNELKELIKDINRATTRIILVGDLIDRGPDSEAVIDFVRDNNIECVKGNHELMAEECLLHLIDYVVNNSKRSKYILYESDWFYNGGHDVFNQYQVKNALPKLVEDIKWLSKLPLYIETAIKDKGNLELLVSHTWCAYKALCLIKDNVSHFIWDRTQPTGRKNMSIYYNIFGHTPVDYVNQNKYHRKTNPILVPEPEFNDGTANVDLGAAYDLSGRRYLCGIFFPSLSYITVKQRTLEKIYYP